MEERREQLSEIDLDKIKETELFLDEVYNNPDVANAAVPPSLQKNVFGEIQTRKAKKAAKAREMLCDEDKELLRLGRIYKKRRKVHRYLVFAAIMVFVVALGITSIGDSEKIFGVWNWDLADREQVNVDSEDENVVPIEDVSEEEIYQQIEDEFGFLPVKLNYLPTDVGFIEGDINEEIQYIYMVYGEEDVNISYQIRPHHRESSWGKDIEDELIEEYEMIVNNVKFCLKKYRVVDGTERWFVGFEYQNTSYSIMLTDLEEQEVTNVINGLYFP